MFLQVQTQPLTCVALVSWVWCIRCTLWWTQRLYRWLETSTSYHNTPHRYQQLRHTSTGQWARTRGSSCVHASILFGNHISLILQRHWNTSHCRRAAVSWPWPLTSLQRDLEQKENFPSGINKVSFKTILFFLVTSESTLCGLKIPCVFPRF